MHDLAVGGSLLPPTIAVTLVLAVALGVPVTIADARRKDHFAFVLALAGTLFLASLAGEEGRAATPSLTLALALVWQRRPPWPAVPCPSRPANGGWLNVRVDTVIGQVRALSGRLLCDLHESDRHLTVEELKERIELRTLIPGPECDLLLAQSLLVDPGDRPLESFDPGVLMGGGERAAEEAPPLLMISLVRSCVPPFDFGRWCSNGKAEGREFRNVGGGWATAIGTVGHSEGVRRWTFRPGARRCRASSAGIVHIGICGSEYPLDEHAFDQEAAYCVWYVSYGTGRLVYSDPGTQEWGSLIEGGLPSAEMLSRVEIELDSERRTVSFRFCVPGSAPQVGWLTGLPQEPLHPFVGLFHKGDAWEVFG